MSKIDPRTGMEYDDIAYSTKALPNKVLTVGEWFDIKIDGHTFTVMISGHTMTLDPYGAINIKLETITMACKDDPEPEEPAQEEAPLAPEVKAKLKRKQISIGPNQ